MKQVVWILCKSEWKQSKTCHSRQPPHPLCRPKDPRPCIHSSLGAARENFVLCNIAATASAKWHSNEPSPTETESGSEEQAQARAKYCESTLDVVVTEEWVWEDSHQPPYPDTKCWANGEITLWKVNFTLIPPPNRSSFLSVAIRLLLWSNRCLLRSVPLTKHQAAD